jgi:hypothetical protein
MGWTLGNQPGNVCGCCLRPGAVANGRAPHEVPAMCRADLIDAYLSSLKLTAITVVDAGKRSRIVAGDVAEGALIQKQYYLPPSHAELLLAKIDQDALAGQGAAALIGAIEQAAAILGARLQTASQLRSAAESQVAVIAARVKASGPALKPWNARYRQYRLAQVEKGEKAIAYWSYIESKVVVPTVRSFASAGQVLA